MCVCPCWNRSCVRKDSIFVKLEHVFSHHVSAKQTNFKEVEFRSMGTVMCVIPIVLIQQQILLCVIHIVITQHYFQ
jgi:hypothetical protein